MQCSRCRSEAVIFQTYSGRHLCGRHLVRDIEARAKRTVRSHRWMRPGDHIAVPVRGDRRSAALLCFLKKLVADRRDIRLSAFAVPEDPETGSGSETASIAGSLRIPLIETPDQGGPVTKIAMAVSLDDLAEDVLGVFLFGNAEWLVNPTRTEWNGIPVMCPFIAIPSGELDLYWEIEGTEIDLHTRMPSDTILKEPGELLEHFSRRHPATKYAVMHLAETLSNGRAGEIAAAGTGDCSAGKAMPRDGDTIGA